MNLHNIFFEDYDYRMIEPVGHAPYRFHCASLFMVGLIPPLQDSANYCLECPPTGQGSLGIQLHHADRELLDSGVCHIALYSKHQSYPIWTVPVDRNHCDIWELPDTELCDIRLMTPVLSWTSREYFLVLTGMEYDYVYMRNLYGGTVIPLTVESYTPSYRPSRTWDTARTVSFMCDGTDYLLPDERFEQPVYLNSLEILGMTDSKVHLGMPGKQALTLSIFFDVPEVDTDILVGLYREGEFRPLWTMREALNPDMPFMEMTTWMLDLHPGDYFLLLGNVTASAFDRVMQPIGNCIRRKFQIVRDYE